MFVSVSNGNNSYTWINLGEVNVSGKFNSGQNLDDVSIVQNLNTGGADKVPSAAAVKELNARLYGEEDTESEAAVAMPSSTTFAKGFRNGTAESDTVYFPAGSVRGGVVNLTPYREQGFTKIRVTVAQGGYYGYITFLKTTALPDEEKTFAELGDVLSARHNAYNKILISCPASESENKVTTVDIPEDAVAVWVCYRAVNDGSSVEATRHKPQSLAAAGGHRDGDIDTLRRLVEGVSAYEVAQSIVNHGGYVDGSDGQIKLPTSASARYVEVAIGDSVRSVRFNGLALNQSTVAGYAFGYYDNSTWVTVEVAKYDSTAQSNGRKVYVKSVPSNATHFRATTKNALVTDDGFFLYFRVGDNVVDLVNNAKEDINVEIYGEKVDKIITSLGTPIVGSIEQTGIGITGTSYEGSLMYEVPLDGCTKIKMKANASIGTTFCITTERVTQNTFDTAATAIMAQGIYGNTFRGTVSKTAAEPLEITLNDTCKYLYLQKSYQSDAAGTDRTLLIFELTKEVRQGGIVNSINSNTHFDLYRGNLDDNGEVVADDYAVVTGFISHGKGFDVVPKEGFNVTRAVLYDAKHKMVSSRYYASSGIGINVRYIHGLGWGSAKQLPQYYVRLVIEDPATSNKKVAPMDVVEQFFEVFDSRVTREIPSNEHDKEVHLRINQEENVVWENTQLVPYIANYYPQCVHVGLPYTECHEYSKEVGLHVSFKTFLSAVKNIRSVLYTENIKGAINKSSYGLSYHGIANSATFYGTVCSGIYAYAHGRQNHDFKLTDRLEEHGTKLFYGDTGSTAIYEKRGSVAVLSDIDTLWNAITPLMNLWSTGHIAVILDVYKDTFGETQFIVIAESSTPTAFLTPYTKAQFEKRLYFETMIHNSSWALYSDDFGTDDKETSPYSVEPWDTKGIIQNNFMNYVPRSVEIDPDICTFLGDYAAFAINGDANDSSESYNNYKAFLNVHRDGSKYTSVEIYQEGNDTLACQIPIDTNDGTIVKQSDIYPQDAANVEDWVIVDLTKIDTPLLAGKYKAKAVGTSAESGFTHFEFVEVSLSVDNGVASFSAENGTPYYLRREQINGLGDNNGEAEITDQTTQNVSGWFSGEYTYLKLFVRGDYGVVVKRLNMA